jgi:NADPH:quinone reductase
LDSGAEVIRPQGKIVSIIENAAPLELGLLKSKSATFVWEFMFNRESNTLIPSARA